MDITQTNKQPPKKKGLLRRHPIVTTLTCITVVIVAVAAIGFRVDWWWFPGHVDEAVLGPRVEGIPKDAFAAVMFSPRAFEYKDNTAEDRSWVVFIDEEANPIGYIRQKGIMRSQLAAIPNGITYADSDKYYIVKDHIQEFPHNKEHMIQDANGSRSGDRDSYIWVDEGVKPDSSGYFTSTFRVKKDGSTTTQRFPGTVAATGYCQDRYYAVISEVITDDRTADVENHILYSAAPGDEQLLPQTNWTAKTSSYGRGIPITCRNKNEVNIYLSVDDGEHGNNNTGIRTYNTVTGYTAWHNIRKPDGTVAQGADIYNIPPGSDTSWIQRNSEVCFISSEGFIKTIADPLKFASPEYGLFSNRKHISVRAASVNDGRIGMILVRFEDGKGNFINTEGVSYARYDFSTGKELYRKTKLEWYESFDREGFNITDTLVLK